MNNQSPNGYSSGGGGNASGPHPIENPPLNELIDEGEYERTEEGENKRNNIYLLFDLFLFVALEFYEDMQRELSDDAPWKRIQQNTFTRWANEHLKLVNRHIDDLQVELSDGLNLIALIEVLSQKKIPRYNRRPTFRSQKLENVSVLLHFLENTERIRLVNIGKISLLFTESIVKVLRNFLFISFFPLILLDT